MEPMPPRLGPHLLPFGPKGRRVSNHLYVVCDTTQITLPHRWVLGVQDPKQGTRDWGIGVGALGLRLRLSFRNSTNFPIAKPFISWVMGYFFVDIFTKSRCQMPRRQGCTSNAFHQKSIWLTSVVGPSSTQAALTPWLCFPPKHRFVAVSLPILRGLCEKYHQMLH